MTKKYFRIEEDGCEWLDDVLYTTFDKAVDGLQKVLDNYIKECEVDDVEVADYKFNKEKGILRIYHYEYTEEYAIEEFVIPTYTII